MPLLIRNLPLFPGENDDVLLSRALDRLRIPRSDVVSWSLARKGLDARKKGRPKFVCALRIELRDETSLPPGSTDPDVVFVPATTPDRFPTRSVAGGVVIVGTGPAGLFAALRLSEYGITATVLERGKTVEERLRDVQSFWGTGSLDPESNVQFGEGGAGTFSDGKLTTRLNDPVIPYVLRKLVDFGAPPEIQWLAKPHVGTDRLRGVIAAIRSHLSARGFDFRFSTPLTGIATANGTVSAALTPAAEVPCKTLILAPGHSARDTYALLGRTGVRLEAKPFAVGLRVEHPQQLIDRIQYGSNRHPDLPPADYALAWNGANGRSAYSFCMCPGGVVIASSSEPEGVVTNGMSLHARNARGANSALVATVRPEDFPEPGPLGGIEFQRTLERAAFVAGGGGYAAPAQNLIDFVSGRTGGKIVSSYRPAVRAWDLASILPAPVTATLREAIPHFDRKMKGFLTKEATLTGVETRTSAPLKIIRGENFQSITLPGLFPCGEGAGYAGGIMSAALDGIRVADAVAASGNTV